MRALFPVAALLLVACQGSIGSPNPLGPGSDAPPPADDPLDDLPEVSLCERQDATPGPAVLRRLTLVEYARTLESELGVDVTDQLEDLPADARAEGFTNNASTLIVPVELAEGFMDAAAVAVERLDVRAFVGGFVSCRDTSIGCGREVAREVGQRLLRAPLTDEQVARYGALFDVVAAEGEGFDVAAGLVLEALLQSPQFLYRIEAEPLGNADARPVGARELANRLAFALWAAPPDDTLLAAAARGDLDTAAGLEAEARRLLGDARARDVARGFFRDWFHLGKLDDYDLPDDRYPEFDRELASAMVEETLRFFDDLAWSSGEPLITMLTAEHTFLDARMAAHYGIPVDGDGWRRVDLSAFPERRGILTQASLLTAHAQRAEPSIVERGLFFLHDVLCDSVDPPPPSVDATPPELEAGASQRASSDARIEAPVCGDCHARFDPFGHAFDRYDAVGAYRMSDPFGNALSSASIFPAEEVGGEGAPFATLDDFVTHAAGTAQAQACIVQKALQFAVGRPLAQVDGCTVVEILADYETRGGRYEDLVLAIVTHPTFRATAPSLSESSQ